MMNELMNNRTGETRKWLQMLIYLHLGSIANRVLNLIPGVPSGLTTGINWLITAGVTLCLFRLAPDQARYQKAAVFRAAYLVGMVLTAFLFDGALLTLAVSVLSILAVYQEYAAHAALVEAQDSALGSKWHRLFLWGIAAGVVASLGTTAAAFVIVAMETSADAMAVVLLLVLTIPQFAIDAVYIRYVQKMLAVFGNAGQA